MNAKRALRLALGLTLGRLAIGPLFLIVYMWYAAFAIPQIAMPFILLVLLIVSELSDLFDGILARKWNQVTQLGKILDPMADSIVRMAVFFTFTEGLIQLPLLLVFVFLYREVMISTLRTVCALQGTALAARKSGKVKAIVQAVAAFAVVLLLIPYALNVINLETLQQWSLLIVAFAAVYTLISGLEYTYVHWPDIKKTWKSPQK
ncbi:MAG TPA: CDP-diacylglycerol--glycerol-3-phosphate 3-phosphatidyltransferase [Chlamydiales bacterium]|nr:CDP-diacylglycerol--glycerol-3-phosphate 3-phosphatidyltransferase [Chlamydiales bacterium]